MTHIATAVIPSDVQNILKVGVGDLGRLWGGLGGGIGDGNLVIVAGDLQQEPLRLSATTTKESTDGALEKACQQKTGKSEVKVFGGGEMRVQRGNRKQERVRDTQRGGVGETSGGGKGEMRPCAARARNGGGGAANTETGAVARKYAWRWWRWRPERVRKRVWECGSGAVTIAVDRVQALVGIAGSGAGSRAAATRSGGSELGSENAKLESVRWARLRTGLSGVFPSHGTAPYNCQCAGAGFMVLKRARSREACSGGSSRRRVVRSMQYPARSRSVGLTGRDNNARVNGRDLGAGCSKRAVKERQAAVPPEAQNNMCK
ncbi:hypothetical protein FB451DRAFT_1360841 [Mycena latifolia]|nr:hypothetical protein FB451DRAFT_1360841 [Mycena latifolia]